jgi:hypothetical protein
MLVTLDLTARQAQRVLGQAVRAHAKLELEPRPEAHSVLLWGSLSGREKDTLLVDLHDDAGHPAPLAALIGAMCDARTILSGQLCLFSTFVVDVAEDTVPRQLMLAVPETIQVANRRRFARKAPLEPVPVRCTVPGAPTPQVAILANIGPTGLASRVVNPELQDLLYIGDRVELEFVLPWSNEVYTLPAIVCNKNRCREEGHLMIGFEFVPQDNEVALQRLRAALSDETARLTEKEGEP